MITTQQNRKNKILAWKSNFRLLICNLIYQAIFVNPKGIETIDFEMDSTYLERLIDTLYSEHADYFEFNNDDKLIKYSQAEIDKAKEQFQYFAADYSHLKAQLEPFLSSWNNTFDIIKAILFSFMLEYRQVIQDQQENTETTTALMANYIQIAEDLTVAANVKLVHAILAKMVN
jgi:hypothetical protein